MSRNAEGRSEEDGESPQMPQPAKEQIIAAVNAKIARLSLPSLNLAQGTDIARLPKAQARRPMCRFLATTMLFLRFRRRRRSRRRTRLGQMADSRGGAYHPSLRSGGRRKPAGACYTIDKDMVLVVRADEAFPRSLAMRFLRKGDQRAEVELPAMAAVQTAKLRLPSAVCARVVRSTVEIGALGSNAAVGTVAGTVAEYNLRC